MPVSSSEARGKWKRRKREPQINKRKQSLHDEDDVVEDELDDDNNDLDHLDNHHQTELEEDPSDPAAPAGESEVISVSSGVRISTFPSVVRHTVNRPHSSVLSIVAIEKAGQSGETVSHASASTSSRQQGGVPSLENISYGQLQALSAVPADSLVLSGAEGDGASASYVITPPLIREGNGVVKQFKPDLIHAIPMHSDWFSPFSINRIERQVVPHFFSGKSSEHTPEKYMDCRNAIVAKYMESPATRLSASDCYGFVVGVDTEDVNRIVRFLDNWGIINYCAAPVIHETRNDCSYLSEDVKGELCVPATALKSIDSLIHFDKPKCMLKAADIYPGLVSEDHDNSDLDSRLRDILTDCHCNHCSRPLASIYYQSQKEVDVLLCLDCFNDGRFVSGHSSLDFVKFDSTKDYGDLDGDNWTDQETLSLLEGIEICNQNWNQIAEHVGSKTKAQCIVHFVRLTADEASLETLELPSLSIASNLINGDDNGRSLSKPNGVSAGASLDIHGSETRLPFAKSGNPVMSQVAFLASAVGPRVAAACAHASLAALSLDDHEADLGNAGQNNGPGSVNRMNSESRNAKEGVPKSDATNSIQQKEELGSQGARSQSDADVAPLSSEKVQNAARAGLSAAAMKAKLFADHEEREIQRLSANIINHQLKRLELKLKQFAEVETLLMKECEQVERARQRIAADRVLLMSSQFGASGVGRPTGLPGVGSAIVSGNNNPGSSRQQQVSGSPSQPFISGYPSNLPIHPHMSQQQSMYGHGLGPRLPLTAINPSSSAVTHPMLRPVPGSRSGFD